jgi:hypothetical protein
VVGTVATAWPFLAGAGVGWLAVGAARWRGAALPGRGSAAGATVLGGTVVAGMMLRLFVAGGGTPASFVVVATCFLGLFLLGWRWATRRWTARRLAGEMGKAPSR